MKSTVRLFPMLVLAAFVAGCSSGSSDMSAKDSAETQNNFSRGLSPAEKAKIGGGAAPAAPADKQPASGG